MPSKTPRTTNQKRLGHDHQINRQRLLARHVDGTPCWWCGKPLYGEGKTHLNHDGRTLHADHSKSRSTNKYAVADRLLHASCNESRGDGTRDHLRPALNHHTSTDHRLGTLTFDWP